MEHQEHFIVEGQANVLLEDSFYNNVQEFNRDLSIAVINTFLKDYNKTNVSLLEALSASGLRSVRYGIFVN
jgi:tRNA (guanine26-N2/guanine27-N2)-dimethyltransferase